MLSGAQRLAEFQADRVLVCRAEHMSKGRRQRHAMIVRDGAGYALSIRLVKAATGPRHLFPIRWKPQADDYVSPVIDALASGETRLLKVSIKFERPGRKVFALLTYEKIVSVPATPSGTATLGPLEADGTCWLRLEPVAGRQARVNYTDRVHRLLAMKLHFAGIHRRLRGRTKRTGRGHQQRYRQALVKAGSFSAWAKGPVQTWSADVIAACRRHEIGTLQIAALLHHDLPMFALVEQVTYKAAAAGIAVVALDVATPTTDRAIARPVEKQRQGIAAQRKALATLRKAV
jgi:hypothetical protein